MSSIEGKGGVKDNHWSAQNAALFIDLLWNIIYRSTKRRGKCYLKLSKNILLPEFLPYMPIFNICFFNIKKPFWISYTHRQIQMVIFYCDLWNQNLSKDPIWYSKVT